MRRTRLEEEAQINITPLIDIIFILLLFFVLTTTFDLNEMKSIDLQLPEAYSSAEKGAFEFFNVLINAKNELYLEQKIVSLEELTEQIKSSFLRNPSLKAAILADKSATHGTVVSVMDAFRTQKVLNINIQVVGK